MTEGGAVDIVLMFRACFGFEISKRDAGRVAGGRGHLSEHFGSINPVG